MMNVYLDGSEFALKRFEISSSKVSVFIASVQSVRSLATLLALIVCVILLLIGDNLVDEKKADSCKQAGAILSAFFLALFAFLQLIYFCISHGHQYVVRYFWLHVATGFCIGLLLIYPYQFFGKHGPFLSYGLQITGAFTSILHYILKKILNFFELDVNFWLIAIHLFIVFVVAFLGFIVFSVAVVKYKANRNEDTTTSSTDSRTAFQVFQTGAMKAWAPITMAVVAMAFEFVIYPVICPILTVDPSKHHTILLWALIVETFSGTMVFMVTGINKDITREWNSGPQRYYHLLWLLFVPYFLFGLIFIWALHHPNSGFAMTIKFGVWGGILTCLYYLSAENLVNIGFGCPWGHAFTGAEGQYKEDGDPKSGLDFTKPKTGKAAKAAGYVMNFTNCLTNSFGVLTGFLIKAHLANYLNCSRKLAEGHVFPTASMNGFRSCWFWFSCASSGAWKNFISMFSLDIKEMLLSLDGYGGFYRKFIRLNDDAVKQLNLSANDGKLENVELKNVQSALKPLKGFLSGLTQGEINAYSSQFVKVFNTELREVDLTPKDDKEKIKKFNDGKTEKSAAVDTLKGKLDSVSDTGLRTMYAEAFIDGYNTAVEVDSDDAVESELDSKLTSGEDEQEIKNALNEVNQTRHPFQPS
ncbi:hypothetical protein BdWA1_002863 [Babesia duncani]|uniref:Uncharacterized protein n=1 Tax=Babesia duncani TaxID=323732 RepID=A0AAD9UMW9_9APIC|nr:hypothetical protein BdWA1_002863 [Babesia duncani]